MLDRVMRLMSRSFESGQHLHGGQEAAARHVRAWALLPNFRPWSPASQRRNGGPPARRSVSTSTVTLRTGRTTSCGRPHWAVAVDETARPKIRDGQIISQTPRGEAVGRSYGHMSSWEIAKITHAKESGNAADSMHSPHFVVDS